jgi:hypothetical protein
MTRPRRSLGTCRHAWDTAPQFCGLEIVNAAPDRRQRGIRKGRRTPSHTPRQPRPSASRAVAASARVVSGREPRSPLGAGAGSISNPPAPCPRRSAGVEITRTSEPNGGNRNGQGSRLHKISDRKITARWLRRCSRPGRVRMIPEFCNFSMGSAFRAIGQSPTRNALVTEN